MNEMEKTQLLGMTPDELAAYLKALGQPAFRAKQVFSWLHQGAAFEQMSNLPKALRETLAETCTANPVAVLETIESKLDGTIKLLYPRISPDGKWLSYRGTDNSSVWLMNLETQENRLLMDGSNARSVIWLDDARLVASLTDENGSYHLVVVDINDCGISRVDGIQTELMDAILVK